MKDNVLKHARLDAEVSQCELSVFMGICAPKLHKLEENASLATLAQLKKAADALGEHGEEIREYARHFFD